MVHRCLTTNSCHGADVVHARCGRACNNSQRMSVLVIPRGVAKPPTGLKTTKGLWFSGTMDFTSIPKWIIEEAALLHALSMQVLVKC